MLVLLLGQVLAPALDAEHVLPLEAQLEGLQLAQELLHHHEPKPDGAFGGFRAVGEEHVELIEEAHPVEVAEELPFRGDAVVVLAVVQDLRLARHLVFRGGNLLLILVIASCLPK